MATLNATNLKHASSSSNNIVLASDGSTTISGNATCSGTATGFGGGKILQVVSTTRTDTFSASITESQYANALSVTIDNVASGSKIFVTAHVTIGLDNDNEVEFAFFRGGSILSGAVGAAAGNRTRSTACGKVGASSSPETVCGQFLDTSPGTGSITYDARLSHQNNGSARTIYLNRSHSDGDNDQDSRLSSTITVMEIGS